MVGVGMGSHSEGGHTSVYRHGDDGGLSLLVLQSALGDLQKQKDNQETLYANSCSTQILHNR